MSTTADVVLNNTEYGDLSDDYPWEYFEEINFVLTQSYLLVSLIGLLGNSLVLSAIIRDTNLHSNTNILLVNGCVADLCVAVFVAALTYLERMSYTWRLGNLTCKLRHFFGEFTPRTSVLVMLAIGVERYIVIVNPLAAASLLQKRRLILAATLAWIIPATISLPTLYLAEIQSYFGEFHCYTESYINQKVLFCGDMLLFYITPVLVMAGLYARAIVSLLRSIRAQSNLVAETPRGAGAVRVTCKSRTTAAAAAAAAAGESSSRSVAVQTKHGDPGLMSVGGCSSLQHSSGQRGRLLASTGECTRQTGTSCGQTAKSRMNLVIMLSASVIFFTVLTFPHYFSRVYYALSPGFGLLEHGYAGLVLLINATALRCLAAALNPAIYLVLSRRIRSSVVETTLRCFRRDRSAAQAYDLRSPSSGTGVTTRVNQGQLGGGGGGHDDKQISV